MAVAKDEEVGIEVVGPVEPPPELFVRVSGHHRRTTSTSCAVVASDHNDPLNDSEQVALVQYYSFEDTCRLARRMGIAAFKYGATAQRIEKFLSCLMSSFGYYGVFLATHTEIFCTFQRSEEDIGSASTQMIVVKDGIHLHKLALLSELASQVKKQNLSPEEATLRLTAIDHVDEPWTVVQTGVAYFLVGACFAALFDGSWWEIALGSNCGGLVFVLMSYFESLTDDSKQWLPLVASFMCSFVATVVKFLRPGINVTLVTMSGNAILLPGFSMAQGTQELVTGHTISGMRRVLQGTVTFLWLVTGSALGRRVVETLVHVESAEQFPPVAKGWFVVFLPLLFLSISVVVGNSRQDVPWAFLCMVIAYGSSVMANLIMEEKLGTFVSSVAMKVFANVWSNKMDRPDLVITLPAFLIKVAGSFGLLGLVHIVEGDTFVGIEKFMQMFLVSLLIISGLFAGNTLVPMNSSSSL